MNMKYVKTIQLTDETLILFNKCKSKILSDNSKSTNLTDNKTIELVLKQYLGDR